MAISMLSITFETNLQDALDAAKAAGIRRKGRNEVVECLDMAQVWREWFSLRFGELLSVRHRSNPDDPPDIELIFPEKCIAVEHTRLQLLGWADDIAKEIDPSRCIAIPPVSGPHRNRSELRNLMLGIGSASAGPNKERTVTVKKLVSIAKRKIKTLPHGSVICVVDEMHLFPTEFAGVSHECARILNSDAFGGFDLYTLILLSRSGPNQTRSALIRRQEPILFREIVPKGSQPT
jgi:hypothetical protein